MLLEDLRLSVVLRAVLMLHTRGILGGQLGPSWGSNLLALVSAFLFHPSCQTLLSFCSLPVAGRALCLGVAFSSPDRQKVNFVLEGLRHGFQPGFSSFPKAQVCKEK